MRSGRYVLLAGSLVAVLTALAAASVSASPQPAPPAGSFRSTPSALRGSWILSSHTSSTAWQLEYATCAKLLNYPDAPHPEESRLRPEIAVAMPTISTDRRTYTFQIRNDFAFSPPASGVVTPQSMKWTSSAWRTRTWRHPATSS